MAAVLRQAIELAQRAAERIPTPELNKFVSTLVAGSSAAPAPRQAPPPLLRGTGGAPAAALRDSGERPRLINRDWAFHLENRLRDTYGLQGVPLVIDYVPRKGRRNRSAQRAGRV